MAIMRAAASPAAGGIGRVVASPAQRGSATMACRCASERPMAQAEWRAELAMGTMLRTRSGKRSAHSSTCIPPSEPPMTDADATDPERPDQLPLHADHVTDE